MKKTHHVLHDLRMLIEEWYVFENDMLVNEKDDLYSIKTFCFQDVVTFVTVTFTKKGNIIMLLFLLFSFSSFGFKTNKQEHPAA